MGCAVKQNLEIEQGATFKFKITWIQEDEVTPVDLTNYSARMHVRTDVDATTIFLELTDSNGRVVLNGSTGVIDLLVSAADTAALTAPWAGVYDLELVDGSGEVTRLMYGSVEVSPEVTR